MVLKALRIVAESDVNFAPVFGLSEAPIIEGVRLSLQVESDTPREQIEEVERLAAQRCLGVYYMANAIPFDTCLEYRGGFPHRSRSRGPPEGDLRGQQVHEQQDCGHRHHGGGPGHGPRAGGGR